MTAHAATLRGMNQAFTIALIRALIGAALSGGSVFLTTWGATAADALDKAVLVPTLTAVVGYLILRFGAEGWIDTKAA